MERKLLLVFALTFLVIMLFQPLLKKYGPQPPAKPESSQAAPAQNQAQLPAQTPAQLPAQISTATGAARGKAPPASAPLQAASESETVIENDVYRIVFTNRGGRVKSWVLKKYTDDKGGSAGTGEYRGGGEIWLSADVVDVRRGAAQQAELGAVCGNPPFRKVRGRMGRPLPLAIRSLLPRKSFSNIPTATSRLRRVSSSIAQLCGRSARLRSK